MVNKEPKTAVVLFNLGGPDRLESVRPFLFNLFNDPAILRLPNPFRYLLARALSWLRWLKARKIYAALGGASPILVNTKAQAAALEERLGGGYKVFVCMRYWHPMADSIIRDVREYLPQRIVLLSLYPQYSTTTTESSLRDWHRKSEGLFPGVTIDTVESYPALDGLVQTLALGVSSAIQSLKQKEPYRVLFSAHGLPQKIVDQGDPYQRHVEETTAAILSRLGHEVDFKICYQSRVGPMQWLGPSTEAEIERAGMERRAVILVPVSFVSEHSETLYELDIEYKTLADQSGVPQFFRVNTVGCAPDFIKSLAGLVAPKMAQTTEMQHG